METVYYSFWLLVECNEIHRKTGTLFESDFSVTENQHEYYERNVKIVSSLEQQQLSLKTRGQAKLHKGSTKDQRDSLHQN